MNCQRQAAGWHHPRQYTNYVVYGNRACQIGNTLNRGILRALRSNGVPVRFGDVEDTELIATLPLQDAQWVVSALPEQDANLTLLQALHEHGFIGTVAFLARGAEDENLLASRGVSHIFHPYDDAANFAANKIINTFGSRKNAKPHPPEKST